MKKPVRKTAKKKAAVVLPEQLERLRALEIRVYTLTCQIKSARKARLGHITEADRSGDARPERLGADERLDLLEREVERLAFWSEAESKTRSEHYADDEYFAGRDEELDYGLSLTRAQECAFAAALPRAMKSAFNIALNPKDIRLQIRKTDSLKVRRKFDFAASNGKLALLGAAKAWLRDGGALILHSTLQDDFREMFPEYAHLPVYGVVAGVGIDEIAARYARRFGFYILHLNVRGDEIHPATGREYNATAY